ncbi:MAG: Mov34/MPN/PAD-1 family protein [Candidatus Thorarchaeota archaeon]
MNVLHYTLHLPQRTLDVLHKHAEDSLPSESVCLMFGKITGPDVYVKRIELLDNTAESSRTSFAVDPEIQYRLYIEAEERGESLVCIFHSHPAPPFPSSSDIHNMNLNSVVWLIASKTSGTWTSKAFVLSDGAPNEVTIVEDL